MKKSKKIFLRVIPILVLAFVLLTSNVFAANGFDNFKNGKVDVNADTSGKTVKMVGNVWGIVLVILQVAAVAALVFAGVRYMFASADQKADIKKSMGTLAIGAILVFGASTVVQILTTVTEDIAVK